MMPPEDLATALTEMDPLLTTEEVDFSIDRLSWSIAAALAMSVAMPVTAVPTARALTSMEPLLATLAVTDWGPKAIWLMPPTAMKFETDPFATAFAQPATLIVPPLSTIAEASRPRAT